jgi:hypothetical protein
MPWRLLLALHRAAAEWDVARPVRIQKEKADPPISHCRSPQDPQFFVPSGKQGRHSGTTQKGLTWALANVRWSRTFSANEQCFFSHSKSANSTFRHNFSAKRTGQQVLVVSPCDCSTLHALHVITASHQQSRLKSLT